jgi:hypothetical protein
MDTNGGQPTLQETERETWTRSCKRGKRRENLAKFFENGLVIYIPRRRIMFRKFVGPFRIVFVFVNLEHSFV